MRVRVRVRIRVRSGSGLGLSCVRGGDHRVELAREAARLYARVLRPVPLGPGKGSRTVRVCGEVKEDAR